jgi:hypothetical protein
MPECVSASHDSNIRSSLQTVHKSKQLQLYSKIQVDKGSERALDKDSENMIRPLRVVVLTRRAESNIQTQPQIQPQTANSDGAELPVLMRLSVFLYIFIDQPEFKVSRKIPVVGK